MTTLTLRCNQCREPAQAELFDGKCETCRQSRGFRTHTGEIVTGDRLQAALDRVADDWAALAHAIRKEDAYASHVSEAAKDAALADGLAFAEKIRRGETTGFTTWQRINTALTGECVALLS